MFRSLVFAALVAAALGAADKETAGAAAIKAELNAEASGRAEYQNDGFDRIVSEHAPNVIRVVDPLKVLEREPVSKRDHIVREVFDPDYYQPTYVLDYRYQKTGGRDYTRSDGGQYLILPKGIRTNEHKHFGNFDELLEFVRLQQLQKTQAHLLHPESKNDELRWEA